MSEVGNPSPAPIAPALHARHDRSMARSRSMAGPIEKQNVFGFSSTLRFKICVPPSYGVFRAPYFLYPPPTDFVFFGIFVPPYGFCFSGFSYPPTIFNPPLRILLFKKVLQKDFGFGDFFLYNSENRQIEADFKNSKWDLKLSLRSPVYLPRSNRILAKFRSLESWDSELSNDLNFVKIRHDLFGLVTVSK